MPSASGAFWPAQILLGGIYPSKARSDMRAAVSDLNRVEKSSKNTASSLVSLAGAFTAIVVGQYIRRGITSMVDHFSQLELALTRMKSLTGATQKQLAMYREEAYRVAGITPYGPQETTEALLTLRRATGSATEAMAALQSTTDLSMTSFGKLSLERTAVMIGEMSRTFGFSGEEASAAAAKIYGAAKSVGLGVETYEKVLGRLGVAAMRGGQSFDEMLKAFSLTKRIIPSAQRASQQLIRLMGELGKPKAMQAFRAIGVEVEASPGRLRPMSQILLELTERYKNLDDVLIKDTLGRAFGERSIKPMIAMLQGLSAGIKTDTHGTLQLADALDHINKGMQTGHEAMEQARKDWQNTMTGAVETAREALDKTITLLGEKLAPVIEFAANALKKLIEGFEWLNNNVPLFSEILTTALTGTVVAAAFFAFKLTLLGAKRIVTGVAVDFLGMGQSAAAGARQGTVAMQQLTESARLARIEVAKANAANVAAARAAKGKLYGPQGAFLAQQAAATTGPVKGQLYGSYGAYLESTGQSARRAAKGVQALRSSLNSLAGAAGPLVAITAAFKTLGAIQVGVEKGSVTEAVKAAGWLAGGAAKGLEIHEKMVYDYAVLQTDVLNNMLKKQLEAQRKTLGMQKDGAKVTISAYEYGKQAMKDIHDEVKSLAKFQFAGVDWTILQKMVNRMGALSESGKLKEGEQRAVKMFQEKTLPRVRELALKKTTGIITPKEQAELMKMTSGVGVMGSWLAKRGLIGKGLMKQYREKTWEPQTSIFSKEGVQASHVLSQLFQGQLRDVPGPGMGGSAFIHGWEPGLGKIGKRGWGDDVPELLRGLLPGNEVHVENTKKAFSEASEPLLRVLREIRDALGGKSGGGKSPADPAEQEGLLGWGGTFWGL